MGIPENGREFPRRNHRVQAIEAALGEAKQLCDWHVAFLLHYFPNAASQNTKLAIPWSLVALKRDSSRSRTRRTMRSVPSSRPCCAITTRRSLSTLCASARVRAAPVAGADADATHFVACYEGIDHVMARASWRMARAECAMFKEHQSLDNLLMNIGKHQMTRAGIPVKAVGMRSPGCSIKFKVELAGYFRELEGLPSVDSEHSGQLCFPDSPDDGIATEGTSTRFVVILPVESTMLVEDRRPQDPC